MGLLRVWLTVKNGQDRSLLPSGFVQSLLVGAGKSSESPFNDQFVVGLIAISMGLLHVWLTVVVGFMLRVRVDHRMRVRTRLG